MSRRGPLSDPQLVVPPLPVGGARDPVASQAWLGAASSSGAVRPSGCGQRTSFLRRPPSPNPAPKGPGGLGQMVVPCPPAPLQPGGVRGQHQAGGLGLRAKQGPVASGDPPLGQAAPAVGAWPMGGSEGAVSAPGAAHPAAVDPAAAGHQLARAAPVWPLEAWREASLVPCDAGGSSGGRPGGVGHSPCRLASCAARTWWTWVAEPHVHPRGAPADSTPAPPFSAAYNWGRLLHHAPGMPRCPPSPVCVCVCPGVWAVRYQVNKAVKTLVQSINPRCLCPLYMERVHPRASRQ